MYRDMALALQEAAADPKTNITAVTGAGDFYSSGNDLTALVYLTSGDKETNNERIKESARITK
jgi:enoyl-CoA hydratase/carnithine racemase